MPQSRDYFWRGSAVKHRPVAPVASAPGRSLSTVWSGLVFTTPPGDAFPGQGRGLLGPAVSSRGGTGSITHLADPSTQGGVLPAVASGAGRGSRSALTENGGAFRLVHGLVGMEAAIAQRGIQALGADMVAVLSQGFQDLSLQVGNPLGLVQHPTPFLPAGKDVHGFESFPKYFYSGSVHATLR